MENLSIYLDSAVIASERCTVGPIASSGHLGHSPRPIMGLFGDLHSLVMSFLLCGFQTWLLSLQSTYTDTSPFTRHARQRHFAVIYMPHIVETTKQCLSLYWSLPCLSYRISVPRRLQWLDCTNWRIAYDPNYPFSVHDISCWLKWSLTMSTHGQYCAQHVISRQSNENQGNRPISQPESIGPWSWERHAIYTECGKKYLHSIFCRFLWNGSEF